MSDPHAHASRDASEITRRPKGRSERVQRQVFEAALTILTRDGRVVITDDWGPVRPSAPQADRKSVV